jgi:predicted phage-related endonuclease
MDLKEFQLIDLEEHELAQGSPEWAAFRLNHHGTSEAAAMLGLSKTTTRTELLRLKSTGIGKEFCDWVQKNILDYGHEVEAMARPVVEGQLGRRLYPVVCSRGEVSASCDGKTMAGDVAWEHKQWNEKLADSVRNGILPEEHKPQCYQNLMVTGAEMLIFTVSDGTEEKMVSMEVLPDTEWFERILAGWTQFEKDLAEYVPAEVVVAPVAETTEALPALSIQTSGAITILSNLDIFGAKLGEFVQRINLKPETDQDFANAEAAVKVLVSAQNALEAAEANALAQASDVDAMRRTVAAYAKTARDTRLMLEKVIKAEKENRKTAIVTAARTAFVQHVQALESEIKPITLNVSAPDFGGAIKGLKTISSIQDKADVALATGKIEADAQAKDVRDKLAWFKEKSKDHAFLFADMQQIVITNRIEAFQAIVTQRIDAHEAAEEKRLEGEREKIRAEEEAKAAEKVKAEQSQPATVSTQDAKESPPPPSSLPAENTSSPEQRRAVINLGEINRRLGFNVSSDFLESLGFAARIEKNAKLYSACDFPAICNGISRHVLAAATGKPVMVAAA